MGNIGSLENMIRKSGGQSKIISQPDELKDATKIILPGVGHFDNAMRKLKESGFIEVLDKKVLKDKTPILCICLGAQLITKSSEEGVLPGLGWVNAKTVSFKFQQPNILKIPHMGWNDVFLKKDSLLFNEMHEEPCFYFVHSFHLVCENSEDILTTTFYGYEFVSAIEHENIYATQYHPEKSHKYGLKLIKNFIEIKSC